MADWELRRSDRRSVSVEITRQGTVLVRAPRRMPIAQIEAFVEKHREWIAVHLGKVEARREAHPEPSAEEEARLRRLAREILPGRVAYYASRMGVHPTGITVTGARTRFGSCSSKGRLSFSFRLMGYPAEAVDYVVVHELCHLLHMDHSPAFWAAVGREMPDFRERQRMLR